MQTLWHAIQGFVAASFFLGYSACAADIEALIKQLGSDSYMERADAKAELIDIGFPAVKRLQAVAKSDPDIETRIAATYIVSCYFKGLTLPENCVEIWFLPRHYRYKEDKDVAKDYYGKARDLWNKTEPWIGSENWYDDKISRLATYLYFRDLLLVEDGKSTILKSKEEMTRLYNRYDSYTIRWWPWDFVQLSDAEGIQRPVEDLLEDLEKNKDKFPYPID